MTERTETTRVTRLAPSPTGTLHLGNALTFMVNWALARRLGWQVVLRIEDLNTGRVREGSDREAVEVLHWLGMDWDDGPVYQSADLSVYEVALTTLREQGLIYPCSATRKEIEQAASAPHVADEETRYPGLNRPKSGRYEASADALLMLKDNEYAWRLIVPDGPVDFVDAVQGPQSIDVQAHVGDFVVATKAGMPSYQLAVVVDDARQGVTDVVRGDDLVSSTSRQILLYRMLGLGDLPRYWHLPLVLSSDGRRMAKRDDTVRLTTYMQAGVSAQRVIGLLGKWAGLTRELEPMTAQRFAELLDTKRINYPPPHFTQEDEQWLMSRD